jgi:hypothetical protein
MCNHSLFVELFFSVFPCVLNPVGQVLVVLEEFADRARPLMQLHLQSIPVALEIFDLAGERNGVQCTDTEAVVAFS